jgi:diacylglycerol kinase (ATP)
LLIDRIFMFEPMRYAALFGILGALIAGAAVEAADGAAWTLAAAEGYVALGLFTMAVAYGLNDRGVPIEEVLQHPGWMHVVGALVLPYRLLARLTLALLRRFDSMEMMHVVGTRLYVGRIPFPSEHPRLAEAGVTSVLNLCAEFPRLSRFRGASGVELAYVPILDGTAPSREQFQTAVDWVAARHAEGRSVLIHCAQGRGRSVTVAAAALCRLGLATDPEDALAKITAARPKAKPSRKQRIALSRFLGTESAQVSTRLLSPRV